MTESFLSDDELLSSFLDSELTAEERTRLDARLEAEPDLRAQLDALRGAAALSAAPVAPLRTGDRERMLAAALAASSTAENVTDLGATRARKEQWRLRLATVAAGVIALAIAVPVLRSIDSDGDSDSESSSDSFETSADASAESGIADDAAADALGGDDAGTEMPLEAASVAPQAEMDSADMADGDNDDSVGESFADTAQGLGELGIHGLTGSDPDFDPLDDDLGYFATRSRVADALARAYTTFRSDDVEEPETTTTDDSDATSSDGEGRIDDEVARSLAFGYLDGFGGCGAAIDEVALRVSDLPLVLAVDWAVARIGGEVFTVGLLHLSDDEAVALVIDTDGCTVGEPVFLP
jgi:hypothetical protein